MKLHLSFHLRGGEKKMTEFAFWVNCPLTVTLQCHDCEKCHGDITDQGQRTLLQLILPFDLDLGDGHIFVLENRKENTNYILCLKVLKC